MTPRDLATLSLLDPDQGVCPNGHRCIHAGVLGVRRCPTCGHRSQALICWDLTPAAIDEARRAGADARIIERALTFLAERGN